MFIQSTSFRKCQDAFGPRENHSSFCFENVSRKCLAPWARKRATIYYTRRLWSPQAHIVLDQNNFHQFWTQDHNSAPSPKENMGLRDFTRFGLRIILLEPPPSEKIWDTKGLVMRRDHFQPQALSALFIVHCLSALFKIIYQTPCNSVMNDVLD